MNNFSYTVAKDLNDTLNQLQSPSARPIGGGTNLIDLMKENVMNPEKLVDINHLELDRVAWSGDYLEVGALVKNSDLAYHPEVEAHFPLLSEAILAGASPQIRNMATTGGNILQRTRCYYFYDVGTPCNKREPGSGCGAITGRNRIHAILGHGPECIAVHPSDMCVALAALDARIRILGKKGTRELHFLDFHRLPGRTPHIDTNLAEGELITHVLIPRKSQNKRVTYLKIRDRASYSFALVSVAATLNLEDGRIQNAAVALGGVAHKPWRDWVLEETLIGEIATDDTYETFANHLLKDAEGFQDNTFKIELARKAIVRAMREASQRNLQ